MKLNLEKIVGAVKKAARSKEGKIAIAVAGVVLAKKLPPGTVAKGADLLRKVKALAE